jgi:hypothetical protein
MPATSFQLDEIRYTLRDSIGNAESANIGFAFVQWGQGYNPKYYPLSEWTMNPINVNWAGTYQPLAGLNGTNGRFSALPTTFDFDSPVFLFAQLSNSNEVWMGQISDILILNGQSQSFDISPQNIKPVVGTFDGTNMYAMDWSTWTPTAIPEPSYTPITLVLLFGVIFAKLFNRKRTSE